MLSTLRCAEIPRPCAFPVWSGRRCSRLAGCIFRVVVGGGVRGWRLPFPRGCGRRCSWVAGCLFRVVVGAGAHGWPAAFSAWSEAEAPSRRLLSPVGGAAIPKIGRYFRADDLSRFLLSLPSLAATPVLGGAGRRCTYCFAASDCWRARIVFRLSMNSSAAAAPWMRPSSSPSVSKTK